MLIRFFVKIFVTNPVIKVGKRGRQTDDSQREAWKTVDLGITVRDRMKKIRTVKKKPLTAPEFYSIICEVT